MPLDGENHRMPAPHRSRAGRASHHVGPLLAVVLTGCASPPATSPQPPAITPAAAQAAGVSMDELAQQQGFARWVAGFEDSARAAGVDDATLHLAFDDAHYMPRAIASDRAQPEFTRAVWDYVDLIVSPARIQRGQQKLAEVQPQLDAATAQYGVPQATIVAIWGMESDYGANFGDIPTIDALATLGFDFPVGRRDRSAFFRGELESYLALCRQQGVDPLSWHGSYAGAIGMPQFMPSSILAHAVDFDGDGHIDLHGNSADVIGSVANFLARAGWQRGLPTHFDVAVPVPTSDRATLLGPDIVPLFSPEEFFELGARLPDAAMALETSKLALVELQNGDAAPSYVAGTTNFYAITRYNWSSYYAMAVIALGEAVKRQR